MTLTAADIVMAFGQENTRRGWNARAHSKPEEGIDLVNFYGPSALVQLTYNAMTGEFTVRFNKFHSSFGDYLNAIARALVYVLQTLKRAGLPFDAPQSPKGVRVSVWVGDDATYCDIPGMHKDPKFLL